MAKKKEIKTNALVVKKKNSNMKISDKDIQSLEVQNLHLNQQDIEKLIYVIRGTQVMLDSDLATLYGVETRAINQAVKRNINRFPDDFMFQLTKVEWANLKSQIETSNTSENQSVVVLTSQNVILKKGRGQHSKFMPYAFTRNGIAMLSSVLRSQIAVEVNISIMRAFTATQQFFAANAQMFQRIEIVEHHQLALAAHQQDTDQQVQQILKLQPRFIPRVSRNNSRSTL